MNLAIPTAETIEVREYAGSCLLKSSANLLVSKVGFENKLEETESCEPNILAPK